MKLIDKAAVVAEIERRIKIHHDYGHYNAEQEFTKVLSFLDTLEVKEVNEEPVSEELEKAAYHNCIDRLSKESIEDFKAGAKWQKAHNWKPADGDDLPDVDREVIALLDNGKVVFAHRPPGYWDGKNIITGKVTRNYPKTYDKGGWNIPDVKYWLDVRLPKEIEL